MKRCLAVVAAAALVSGAATCAEAESPASTATAATAGEMKPYVETIAGSSVTFEMVPIPGGKFRMGSPESEADREDDEGPQVEIEVDPFYMGKYEVTWGEYNEFLKNYDRLASSGAPEVPKEKWADAVSYPTPLYELEAGPILDRLGRGGKYPAVIMSQYGAKQYTKWLSKKTGRFYRLPTEAEWEYAARAGTETAYSFGEDAKDLEKYAWYFDNSETDKSPDGAYRRVGEKKPNAFGLYDMHGNVAEWVIDQYDEKWYKTLSEKGGTVNWRDAIRWADSRTPYPRVIRGGGWESDPEDLRSARRRGSDKSMNVKDPQIPKSPYYVTEGFWLGFRVVSPVNEPSEEEKLKFWEADDPQTRKTIERDREIRELFGTPAPAAAK